ncbi:hypothetical protein [Carboxylicivirga sp. M1479]|uniref:hypothetical protein n=1 Tax=Carboxylicivirga sp. M1479 TaxID=2594476 RepID=UPI0011774997|nr:hypothetical protein [Carboxylicivirga sp. M1479]TRX61012.1 hypothetical protein FNN09_20545 [Carboxylicivirga sp. M1479]
MKQNILLVIFIMTLFSCSKFDSEVIRNHQILNVVLNDRLTLANQNIGISEVNGIIQVKDIILIADSKSDITFDSKRNNLRMFNSITPSVGHPFYMDSINYILKQLPRLSSHSWNTELLTEIVKIENPKDEFEKETQHKTELWISKNKKENSYLVVTEPIFNPRGEVIISAKIFTDGFNIEKCYIMGKSESNWKIKECLTAFSLIRTEVLEDREIESEIFIGYSDK